MTRRNKTIGFIIASCSLAGVMTPIVYAGTVPSLTVYAGPQSVSPRDIIHVTVEIIGKGGNDINNVTVNLSYMSDGVINTISGIPKHGLVSFDIPAQDRVGLMTFSANTKLGASKEALVKVVAAQPQPFSLEVKSGKKTETIKLMSDVIVDHYGNPISDLSLVSVDWIDNKGLKARQNVQLLNGRIFHTAKCPAKFTSPLQIRAAVNTIKIITRDLSSYCDAGQD